LCRRLLLYNGFPFLLPAFPGLYYSGQTVLGRGARTLVATAVVLLIVAPVVRLFGRSFLRVLPTGTAASCADPVVLGRLYQRRSVLVRGEIGFFRQRATTNDAALMVMMPVRRPTVPILQLLIVVVVVRLRRRTVMMVPGGGGGGNVVPAPRWFQGGGIAMHATTADHRRSTAIVRRFNQTVARITIDG